MYDGVEVLPNFHQISLHHPPSKFTLLKEIQNTVMMAILKTFTYCELWTLT